MKCIIAATLLILAAAPAFAIDLQSARAQGLVCEKPDGFITAKSSDAGVQGLVAEVNARRTQEYARISKEKGQPVDVVARLAVPQILSQGAAACK